MKLKRIMDWIRSHKRQAIFIVIVLAVIFCIGIAVAAGNQRRIGRTFRKSARENGGFSRK